MVSRVEHKVGSVHNGVSGTLSQDELVKSYVLPKAAKGVKQR